MSLVDTWIAATRARGLNLAGAIREMNEATGSRYTSSRINEWRRGVREVPATARSHMMKDALPYALIECGVKRVSNIEALTQALI